ncbi:MAG: NAD-dependent epimerase/dehydratase family protein [Gemmatimonadales bacterium]
MTRVLVTGAAGFIGSHLVDVLLARGDDVVGIDNFDEFYPRAVKEANLEGALAKPGFEFREIDVVDVGSLVAALTPDTVIVHLAAKAGVRPSLEDPIGYVRANVTGTAALAEAAHRAGVTRFVFGSSSSVYGDDTEAPFSEDAVAIHPVSPYAATKRGGELMLEALAPIWNLRCAALRFFTVIGPRQRPDLAVHKFTRLMLAGEPLTLFGDGTQSRDYTYWEDIVDGVLRAIHWTDDAPVGVEYFNLGDARPVPLTELVDTIAAALGTTPRIEWHPMQPGDVQHTFADLTKSSRVLGYRPTTALAEGVQNFVDWYRDIHDDER